MAFCHVLLSRLNRSKGNNITLLWYMIKTYKSNSGSRNVHQNTLDLYTENLVQENNNKWNDFIFKKLLSVKPNLTLHDRNVDALEGCTEEQLMTQIIDSIRENDVNNAIIIIKFCKENLHCLPYGFMLYLTKLFAKSGYKNGVELMLSYIENVNEIEFVKNNGFKYYTAQVLWCTGSTERPLNMLEDLYKINSLKHDVYSVISDIISNTLTKHGEASLVKITNFVQKLVNNYNDYYPMIMLWRQLSESDWYADNQLAKTILSNNEELISIISPIIPLWCVQLIKKHKIEVVHRLSETLLVHKYMEHYSSVLHSLFDYYYYQNNLKRCSAVVKAALDLEIPLKESYQKRFLILLTTGKPEVNKHTVSIPKRIEYQINLKF